MGDSILQFGRDHVAWGAYSLVTAGDGRTAAAMSVGARADTPALASKGDPRLPNEDAAYAREDGPHTLVVVADAHHGTEASHELVRAISSLPLPRTFEELTQQLRTLPLALDSGPSASTLVMAVMDRSTRDGFGISFGDSSLVRVGPAGAHVLNVRRAQFIATRPGADLDPGMGHGFHFFIEPDDLLVAFTDGVNECHYRSPATSIGSEHLTRIFTETGAHPEPYARALVELALAGVRGNPGGQDNIALVVSSADPGRES